MFRFKQFAIDDLGCGMKIGTDSVLLGSWAELPQAGLIADLGAGSGVLSLMCAQRSEGISVDAVELDANAASACRANIDASPWGDRLRVHNISAFDYEPCQPLAAIISNPPYFTTGMLSPELARRGARHALAFGPKAVIEIAARHLAADGTVALITPADDSQSLLAHAEMLRLKLRRLCQVSTVEGRPPTRLMWQFSRNDGPIEKSSLVIRHKDGAYTQPYRELTKDFYLAF